MHAVADQQRWTLLIAAYELQPDVFNLDSFVFPEYVDIRDIVAHCREQQFDVIGTWENLEKEQAHEAASRLASSADTTYSRLLCTLRQGIAEALREYVGY